jgi:hypothetical protein
MGLESSGHCIANADAGASAIMHASIDQAHRAISELEDV